MNKIWLTTLLPHLDNINAVEEPRRSTIDAIVEALDVSFNKDGRWNISDGYRSQYVTMKDPEFMAKLTNSTEEIRAHDIYRVKLEVEEASDDEHPLLVNWLAITKVVEHRRPAKQELF